MSTQSLRVVHQQTPRRDDHHEYRLRVRGTIYVWGSVDMSPITFPRPMLLYIHNDLFGEQITVGTQTSGGPLMPLGTLNPGELVTLPLQGYSGIYASCDLESNVRCTVRP